MINPVPPYLTAAECAAAWGGNMTRRKMRRMLARMGLLEQKGGGLFASAERILEELPGLHAKLWQHFDPDRTIPDHEEP